MNRARAGTQIESNSRRSMPAFGGGSSRFSVFPMNPDDTIVAVSSPPGRSVRGIVRLSGPDSRRIVAALVEPSNAAVPHEGGHSMSAKMRRVNIRFETGVLPAILFEFLPPRSYTGEAMMEIHTIGS